MTIILYLTTVGVPRDKDILSVISTWPTAEREAAHRTIAEMENEALDRMALMPGAAALGAFCVSRGIPLGLVTRNTSACIDRLHSTHWLPPLRPFSPAIARNSGLPPKPAPDALLACAAAWGAPAAACAMVGDSARDDIVAARRAGMAAILLRAPRSRAAAAAPPPPEQTPDAVVTALDQVPAALEALFALGPAR
jgi:beta-phosphoglucomutase-like phosphatase (HAD superfamily)